MSMEENLFILGLFDKAYSSYNIHVKTLCFWPVYDLYDPVIILSFFIF